MTTQLYRKYSNEEWQEARRIMRVMDNQGCRMEPIKSSNGLLGRLLAYLMEQAGRGTEWTALYENGVYHFIWCYV